MKHLILIIAMALLIGCESDPVIIESIELTTQEKLIGHWSTDKQLYSTQIDDDGILEIKIQYECIIESTKFHIQATYYYSKCILNGEDYFHISEYNLTLYYILLDKTIVFTSESGLVTKFGEILKITKDSLKIDIPIMPRNREDCGILEFSKIN